MAVEGVGDRGQVGVGQVGAGDDGVGRGGGVAAVEVGGVLPRVEQQHEAGRGDRLAGPVAPVPARSCSSVGDQRGHDAGGVGWQCVGGGQLDQGVDRDRAQGHRVRPADRDAVGVERVEPDRVERGDRAPRGGVRGVDPGHRGELHRGGARGDRHRSCGVGRIRVAADVDVVGHLGAGVVGGGHEGQGVPSVHLGQSEGLQRVGHLLGQDLGVV